MLAMMSLRERNRHNAMTLTQRTALGLFAERGFDAVTVAEIAEAVGMAPSTLYRHFATKEAIVLWDEHEAALVEAIERELAARPPLAALREACITELANRYDDDLEFQLARITFLYNTPQVDAAAAEQDWADTVELAAAIEAVLPAREKPTAPLLAGAAILAINHAFDRWQQTAAAVPLGRLIAEAFDTLGRLDAVGRDA